MFSSTGQLVSQTTTNESVKILDISGLAAGVYLVWAIQGQHRFFEKLIIQQ